jgi:putative peptidoglycan lipid II flippase
LNDQKFDQAPGLQESQGSAIKNSGLISALNAIGFASALLVDIVIAARFGLSHITDAFFIAYTIPSLIISILLVSFTAVLVPLFTRVTLVEGKSRLWNTSSNMVNLSMVIFAVIGVAGILLSPVLIQVLGAGLDQETQQLAASLSKVLFLMIIPIGAIEVLKSLLNSLREFAFPAATILILNVTAFTFLLLLSPRWGIFSLAIGYAVGIWVQLVILVIVALIKGFRYKPSIPWKDPRVKEAIELLKFPIAGAVLGQSNILLERFLASFLPVGVITALGYARRVMSAVNRIFLASISTAFLPRLSAQFTRNEINEYKKSISLALQLAIFLSFPITAGIIGLSILIIGLLFGRGAFDYSDTLITAQLLSIYMLSIPPGAISRILNTSFYSIGDTRTPFINRLLILVVNIIADVILYYFFGAMGLAFGLAIAWTIGAVAIARKLNQKINFITQELVTFGIKIGAASLIMGTGVYFLWNLIFTFNPEIFENIVRTALWTLLIVAIGAGFFLLLAVLLRVQELNRFFRVVRMRGLSLLK